MTSKQALTELFNEANRFSFEDYKYNTYDLWQMCKQIQNDLEVLECFKKLFEGEDLDGWIEFNFYADISYINKIKEWLKNEK